MSKVCVFTLAVLLAAPCFAQEWAAVYDGPASNDDEAHALAVDGAGKVYVTGSSYGSGTYRDYATIKYGPTGDTLWVRRYNGPANNHDLAYAIAVDGAGSAYVTGQSYGSSSNHDYLTIKYYPDGDTAWTRRYNGPTNNSDRARSPWMEPAMSMWSAKARLRLLMAITRRSSTIHWVIRFG